MTLFPATVDTVRRGSKPAPSRRSAKWVLMKPCGPIGARRALPAPTPVYRQRSPSRLIRTTDSADEVSTLLIQGVARPTAARLARVSALRALPGRSPPGVVGAGVFCRIRPRGCGSRVEDATAAGVGVLQRPRGDSELVNLGLRCSYGERASVSRLDDAVPGPVRQVRLATSRGQVGRLRPEHRGAVAARNRRLDGVGH